MSDFHSFHIEIIVNYIAYNYICFSLLFVALAVVILVHFTYRSTQNTQPVQNERDMRVNIILCRVGCFYYIKVENESGFRREKMIRYL